uniref:Uncharacterized protein n=1 Tax=Trichogramma kaykai TaxID=54128 RepID=A0ABD2X3Y3_9HYME
MCSGNVTSSFANKNSTKLNSTPKCSENAIHPGAYLSFRVLHADVYTLTSNVTIGERKSVTSVGLRANATLHVCSCSRVQ